MPEAKNIKEVDRKDSVTSGRSESDRTDNKGLLDESRDR